MKGVRAAKGLPVFWACHRYQTLPPSSERAQVPRITRWEGNGSMMRRVWFGEDSIASIASIVVAPFHDVELLLADGRRGLLELRRRRRGCAGWLGGDALYCGTVRAPPSSVQHNQSIPRPYQSYPSQKVPPAPQALRRHHSNQIG